MAEAGGAIPRKVLETRTGATILLTALTAALVLPAATTKVADVDVWWIATAGRDMLASGDVPRLNAYSFVDGAHPWVMHEWLYAVPYALGGNALGPGFFALVGVVFASVMAWLLVRATVGRAAIMRAGVIVAAFALGVFCQRTASARPIGSSEILALAMVLLAFAPSLTPIRVVAITALELVWTNAHGSFPLGVVILAAATWAASKRTPHVVALGLAALVTFVNPYGWHLHELVLAYARAKPATFALLSSKVLEYAPIWRPGYFATVAPLQVGGLVLLLVATVVALARPAGEHRAPAWLALFLLVEGVLHARHVELGGLLACVLLMPWFDRWLAKDARTDIAVMPTVRSASLGIAAVFAIGLLVFGVTTERRSREEWIAPAIGGAPFAHLAAKLPNDAHAYAPFRSAGLLLWLDAARGVRTLYDSRNDCYSLDVMEIGLSLNGELSGNQITSAFDRFGVRYAIVPTDAFVKATDPPDARWSTLGTVERALSASSDWTVHESDSGWVLFERR